MILLQLLISAVQLPLQQCASGFQGTYSAMIWNHPTGQSIIFHQPRFPWNKGISLTKPPVTFSALFNVLGEITKPPFGVRLWGRYNLTRIQAMKKSHGSLGSRVHCSNSQSRKACAPLFSKKFHAASQERDFLVMSPFVSLLKLIEKLWNHKSSRSIDSLKLKCIYIYISPLKIGRATKGNDRIPTIHFQVLC